MSGFACYIASMPDPFDLTDDPAPIVGPAPEAPYLAGLNSAQRAAVEATDGPVLVLAGAGTGKTRVLTTRLAHILMTGRARAWEMMAVTFTNKAAREMRERVSALVGGPVEGWWLGTFHALGARMLRQHAEAVGLKSNFTILDADDQVRLIKQLMDGRTLDDKKWPARAILGVIQRWKDRGLTPEKVTLEEGGDAANGIILTLYKDYQERLRTLNAADFGDLLLHCLTMFTKHPDILAGFQRKFRYLLVDEYQDTNVAQYLWLRLLAQQSRNICCVGDDDQSIYSWRGAEVGNILKFEKDFPGATIVRLEQNYRSTPHILAAASGLIAHNEGRLGKTLWTGVNEGRKVVVDGVWDGEEEARVIGDEIEARHARGDSLDQIAVLVRAGFQTREFEERLITLGIPYRVVGGPRFYERQEIRDAIAYMRVIVSPDDDLAFERIVNVPKRGLGEASLQALHKLSRGASVSLFEASRMMVESDEMKPKPRGALKILLDNFERWRANLAHLPAGDLAELVLDESGYTEMWQRDRTPEAPGRLDNLKEFVSGLDEFETLQGFLEHVSLVMDNEQNTTDAKVNIMTLHAAKGLEFDLVFLPGWEEGLFPHQRSLDEEGLKGLEEERRLAYVGLTRARHEARVSCAANRRIYNQWQNALPSRFIEELPKENVERSSARGLGAQTGLRANSARGFAEMASAFTQNYARPPRRDGVVIDGDAWLVPDEASEGRFYEGSRVFHQKFGYGRVLACDGNKLEVAFDKAGTKRVIDSFVEPA
jgi:DNA helicase-2/ATP-dependent DNA helicase PcrA